MSPTKYSAKYAAFELTRHATSQSLDRLSVSIFDSKVDLNPHQLEAALFALANPLSKGVILADEVGLGKTIEAGLVLCQMWAEKKRRLVVICPASLRRQWASELEEKFHLPTRILDKRAFEADIEAKIADPFDQEKVLILSYPFAAKMAGHLSRKAWDRVVIDEAHRLRNAHRESNRTGQALRRAFPGSPKLLLTATPLQNSLLDLYGLSTLIDEEIFGDITTFRRNYMRGDSNLNELKQRMRGFLKRTLRRDVTEYVPYTNRKTITQPFTPADVEVQLYDKISAFLQREGTYSLPERHRHLTLLILRKLLASSSSAIGETLKRMVERLERLKEGLRNPESLLAKLTLDEEIEDEYLDQADSVAEPAVEYGLPHDPSKLDLEIAEIKGFIYAAAQIGTDSKTKALLTAIQTGFAEMEGMGAKRKAVVFTESRRTQDYLRDFLCANGYDGKVATFNGTNNDPFSKLIHQQWVAKHKGTDKVTGSVAIDRRSALIDHFREDAEILVATEAAGEGINLQFCSLLVNYDLPWNPQRVEQRIGRCHRYGQKFDVVVVNFLNQRNQADQRVLTLLTEKFTLFDGVFGASDDILGRIESGIDFEKRILSIYQTCRNAEEISAGFTALQKELEVEITDKLDQAQGALFSHFDQQVHDVLKVRQAQAGRILDRMGRLFWGVTHFMLAKKARFEEETHGFDLLDPPLPTVKAGFYQLVKQEGQKVIGHEYRLGHPLGNFVIEAAKNLPTPGAHLKLDLSGHPFKLSLLEPHLGKQGSLLVLFCQVSSLETEEKVLVGGWFGDGEPVGEEEAQLLASLGGQESGPTSPGLLAGGDSEVLSETLIQDYAKDAENRNFGFYKGEKQKLELWAEEKTQACELEIDEVKAELVRLNRDSKAAESLEQERQFQGLISEAEKKLRRLRRNSLNAMDDIIDQRDDLIERLQERMNQDIKTQVLYQITFELR